MLFFKLFEGLIGGHVFKNVGERCTPKNHCPVSLLSAIGKVFGKLVLVNNRLFDHQEKCALFCDFQYDFKSCRSNCRLSDSCI